MEYFAEYEDDNVEDIELDDDDFDEENDGDFGGSGMVTEALRLNRVTDVTEDISYAAQFADIPVLVDESNIAIGREVGVGSGSVAIAGCGGMDDDDSDVDSDDDDDDDEVEMSGHKAANADADDEIDDDFDEDDEVVGASAGPIRSVHEESYPVEFLDPHSEKIANADEVLVRIGDTISVIRESLPTKREQPGGKGKKHAKKNGQKGSVDADNAGDNAGLSESANVDDLKGADSSVVVVILSTEGTTNLLSIGTILCLQNRIAIGKILEVLGPVTRPFYTIKLLSNKSGYSVDNESLSLSAITTGLPIYTTDRWMKPISRDILYSSKGGSDASNAFDEELPEDEQEYSDDEKELAAKQARNKAKRTASAISTASGNSNSFNSSNSSNSSSKSNNSSFHGNGIVRQANNSNNNRFMGASNNSYSASGGGGSRLSQPDHQLNSFSQSTSAGSNVFNYFSGNQQAGGGGAAMIGVSSGNVFTIPTVEQLRGSTFGGGAPPPPPPPSQPTGFQMQQNEYISSIEQHLQQELQNIRNLKQQYGYTPAQGMYPSYPPTNLGAQAQMPMQASNYPSYSTYPTTSQQYHQQYHQQQQQQYYGQSATNWQFPNPNPNANSNANANPNYQGAHPPYNGHYKM